jgi:uncharacterized protein YkwD
MRHLLLLALVLASRTALAQEIDGRDLAWEVGDQSTWRTQIVVKISRHCRRGFCFQVVRYEEVAPQRRATLPPSQRVARVEPLPQPINAPARDLAPAPRAVTPTCGTADESRAFALLNAYRQSAQLSKLSCDPQALKVARAHSQDMCDRRYFSHTTPEGKAPWDRMRAGGVSFRAAGENIAQGYDTAQGVHDGWVASDGHRANMLNASWTRGAVGLVDCQGGRYWTQLFAR